MTKILFYLKNFDWIIFFSAFSLSCFGLIEIYSIALGQETLNLLNFKKQIIFVIAGVLVMIIFSFINYNFIKNSSKYIYFLGGTLLGSVLIFGKTIRNAKSWFAIGGFHLQPTEFIKIVLLIFLAKFFATRAVKIRSFKQLLYSGTGSSLFIMLTIMQPDLGSAIILFSIWLVMLAIAGFNKKIFISLFLVLIMLFFFFWSFYLKDYQKKRIIAFIAPDPTSLTQGYNVSQAIIAIGAGRITGRGIGFGSQSQLKFLPEAQNDFIFAVISEEFGLMGVILIFTLYLILFFRIISYVKKINNDFSIFFILGAMGLIFIEMFINISMNIGFLPVIGISLPFISYGGSAIISHFILIGMIENIIIKAKTNY